MWDFYYLMVDCCMCGCIMHMGYLGLPISPFKWHHAPPSYCSKHWMFFCIFKSSFVLPNLCFQSLPLLHPLLWLVVVLVCHGVLCEATSTLILTVANWCRHLFKAHHLIIWIQQFNKDQTHCESWARWASWRACIIHLKRSLTHVSSLVTDALQIQTFFPPWCLTCMDNDV